MKFKGHVLKVNNSEYTLKQQLSQGGFSLIYTTNKPQILCKVQVISQNNICQAYYNQKKCLNKLKHDNIIKLHASQQTKLNGSEYGFMLLQNCSKGNAFNVLQQSEGFLPQKTILKIALDTASALQFMHSKGIAHRDIKLQNILLHQNGLFKLCDFGSCSFEVISQINKENRAQIQQNIQKSTTPLYRSPQQLDLYSGYEIGTQVDVFALGVLCFMLCFKKQPFQTRLSSINKQYFLPNQHPYSQDLVRIIQNCFTTNPKQRPTAAIVKQELINLMQKKKAQIDFNYEKQLQQTIDELSRINDKNFKKTNVAQSSFFDKIRRIYNQMTTQTQGWIIGFIQDSQEAPNLKFNRSIISKCWEKRYKVEKFYEILWRFSQEFKSKCLVTLKLLTLLHNFLRKGPAQGLAFDSPHSPIKLCTKIYNHWKSVQKPTHQQDVKRNIYVMLLIRLYSLIIIGKVRLCYENSDLFEGNYSIVPFLCGKQEHTILRIPLIQSMIDFLSSCTRFHQILQKHSYIVDIQRTIILSIVDQQYCLVSTLTFILAAFKNAINYVSEDLDIQRLNIKIKGLQQSYAQVYTKLHELFKQTSKLASLFEHNQFDLPLKVIDYLANIKIDMSKKGQTFKINNYLNHKQNICGLKIPLTYQQVVKNPNFLKDIQNKRHSKQYIEINQFKAQKQSIQSKSQKKQQDKRVKSPTVSTQSFRQKQAVKSPRVSQDQINKLSPQIPSDSRKKKSQSQDFSSFSFKDVKKNKQQSDKNIKTKDRDIFNTMQFTHQNLNKDFLTRDHDQFADFMSMVDQKYQNDKKNKNNGKETDMKKNKSPNQITQVNKNTVKQGQQNIKKIQLINFFDDDQQPSQKAVNNQKKSSEEGSPKKQEDIKLTKSQQLMEKQKKQMISKIKQVNINEQNFRSDSSFIDLKGFIVQEVKKTAQQYIIEYSALKFKKKVGFGHSSQVFKGEWRGREVAIKKIKDDMSSPSIEKQFRRQIMTSVKIRHHPQLVTLIGVAQHDGYYYIINQYCHGATLFDVLHQSQVPLPWRTRISIAKQIAKGMIFLHTNEPPIIHRDLKSLNVLLVNKYSDKHPQSMQIKIADFGLSRDFASTYMTGTLGTYHWMAPEIFNNQPYTLKADVYSFGIVLWQIMARKPPYLNLKHAQALMKFVTIQNGRPDMKQIPADAPADLVKLMIRCWDRSPQVRPSFEQILQILTSIPFF